MAYLFVALLLTVALVTLAVKCLADVIAEIIRHFKDNSKNVEGTKKEEPA